MKYLISGLGNIGAEYELTRHNIGFLVLDQLADKLNAKFSTQRLADKAEGWYKGRTLHLIKPGTYMNLSGKAVLYWMNALKIPKENLLVVVDDVALPFGSLRMRGKGSTAGHNGLRSIETELGGSDYPRLRFGIGDNFPRGHQVDYVLSRFTQEEFDALPKYIDKAVEMILSFCTQGLDRTMSQYND
jgi:PTH1 family peptidyl-tRNA hydrolase